MPGMQEFIDIACPYCGEWIEIAIDTSVDQQQYIEDCQVCCRPITISVSVDEEGQAQAHARSENDA